jgi:hypothetical protein
VEGLHSPQVHRYQVYGLTLEADFPLPELSAADPGPTVVRVRRAPIPLSGDAALSSESWLERLPEGGILNVFEGVGRYLVRADEVVVDPLADADQDLVRHLLLGPVLAQVLWERGIFALHGSVVGIGERYVAFVGPSGEGKSTMAAALQGRGHALVCDDVAALEVEESVRVRPGFPRIRLHPDVLVRLGEAPEAHARVHGELDKRLLPAAAFATGSVCLSRVYVLGTGAVPAVEPLAQRDAMMELMRHTYYPEQFVALYGFARHMRLAARVAERVRGYRFSRPRDLAQLEDAAAFLEAHVVR